MSRVIAIVGTYRRGGMTDQAVDAILDGARRQGAQIRKVYLTDRHIEFCRNCRFCTQEEGRQRGRCVQEDDLEELLQEVEHSDGIVLGSPVNDFNVTAIFRRFMERLLGYTYWPWGQAAPKMRSRLRTRRAVLVASAAMPGLLIPLATGAARALRLTATTLGAAPVGKLWIGQAAQEPEQKLSPRTTARAVRLGQKLVRGF
jgi:NAD(P)H-dependent FMN reductase